MDSNFRPESLEEFVGQKHLVAPGAPFYRLLKSSALPHSFFFGPPGTGKTTLAGIVAKELGSDFFELNATSLKVDEIRKIVANYKNALIKPLIFIDEVHRLSRTQQEVLLPIMEKNEALIIGASTENPFYALTAAIRSRSVLFEFYPLSKEDLQYIASNVSQKLDLSIEAEAMEYLIEIAAGDARNVVKFLRLQAAIDKKVTKEALQKLAPKAYTEGSKDLTTHYELASALIKSIRGSDIDAALYYLARLILSKEPPEFIARRLVILASEDIGNANPNALELATATLLAVKEIGYPEARIILSQCVIYLASSPKSNSAYEAINRAMEFAQKESLPIPKHLLPPKFAGYLYPHDYGGYVKQEYMSKPMRFYKSRGIAYEKRLDEWITKIKKV